MKTTALITPVLIAGCIILMLSFAVRASFGIFQIPVAEEFGWLRAEFSMAIAIQNLFWGIGQPIFGAIAEKVTDRKAITLGGLVYALGLILSSYAVTPGAMQTYGILVGFGIAGTGFGVILAVVGRAASDEHRSMALAIATAAGSAGQVIGAPLAEYLLGFMSWQHVFITFAAIIIGSLIFLPMMKTERVASRSELEESIGEVLIKAFKDPSYTLIFLGFFSCGYQLGFITAHFPAFVTELCGPIMPGGALHSMGITTTSRLGALAISLIGLANIAGTLAAGYLGKHYSKKIPTRVDLFGPNNCSCAFYCPANHADLCDFIFRAHGVALAGHCPAHLWFGRAYLWVTLHGYALRHCLFLPPTRRFPWSLAGGGIV